MRPFRLLVVAALLAAVIVATLALIGTFGSEPFGGPDSHWSPPRVLGLRPRAMHTIYLERRGLTLTAGTDDSTQNRSSVLGGARRATVTIPPFAGKDAAWRTFVDCFRAKYAPFDVDIVEERPHEHGYILVAVGGPPTLLGLPATTTGVAPFDGDVVEDAVVFVFSHAVHEDTSMMCDTAAMETAHAYGLDHECLCKDPMTYLPPCGPRSFQNVDARCGEKTARNCENGHATQNSFQRLMAVLGPHPNVDGAHAATDRRGPGNSNTPVSIPANQSR